MGSRRCGSKKEQSHHGGRWCREPLLTASPPVGVQLVIGLQWRTGQKLSNVVIGNAAEIAEFRASC
jgi:hypothetical protein